jgi:phosphoenolpyruvate-protein phosphotransferase (PTS system enzyme I)
MMKIVKGTVISPGIACGKAFILRNEKIAYETDSKPLIEKEKFLTAVSEATKEIELEITEADSQYDRRISEIFDAHKYIVNDPVLKQNTLAKIENGLMAFKAYEEAVHEFIRLMEVSDNEYMLGRIIDIIDASDKVKDKLGKDQKKRNFTFDESTIIIEDEIKPSVVFSSMKAYVRGFISRKGYFHQHSGIIGRTIKIPEIIIPDILDYIEDGDLVLIDGNEGQIYIKPTEEILKEKGV